MRQIILGALTATVAMLCGVEACQMATNPDSSLVGYFGAIIGFFILGVAAILLFEGGPQGRSRDR